MKKLDLSESDVSNAALTVISTSCPLLQTIDLNAAKMSRTDVSSQGFHTYFLLNYNSLYVPLAL